MWRMMVVLLLEVLLLGAGLEALLDTYHMSSDICLEYLFCHICLRSYCNSLRMICPHRQLVKSHKLPNNMVDQPDTL